MCRHQGVWCSSRRAPSPTWTHTVLVLCLVACRTGDLRDEERLLVLVARAAAPPGDVAEDVEYLLGAQADRRRDGLGRHALIERVHAHVERAQRNAEEELFLRLREGVG